MQSRVISTPPTTAALLSPAFPAAGENGDPFDLNVAVLVAGDGTAAFIDLTDDGCKPTCAGSCASAAV